LMTRTPCVRQSGISLCSVKAHSSFDQSRYTSPRAAI
jgi:hypothetical protein